MLRRRRSPVTAVNALALTVAALLAGAWDLSGHGHDPASAGGSHCAASHEIKGGEPESRATVGEAMPLHDHSCVACALGRSQTPADHGKWTGAALDRIAAGTVAGDGEDTRNGESWQRSARGPPRS